MLQSVQKKVILHDLNLDYSIEGLSVETQTNLLINKNINQFICKFKDKFENKIFIYDYNDDLISLVGYNILLIIQSIEPTFNFYLYGNKKRTKTYLKGQKFFSYRSIKKNKDDIILISSFNPIYKVDQFTKVSKIFGSYKKDIKILVKPRYKLMEQFTPEELFEAQKFYHIGYIKPQKGCENIDSKNSNISSYNEYLINDSNKYDSCFIQTVPPQGNIDDYKDIAYPGLFKYENSLTLVRPHGKQLIALYVDDDIEQTNKYLQYIEITDRITLYFGKWNSLLDDKGFKFIVTQTANRPSAAEFNNFTLLGEFFANGWDIEWLGNWPKSIKEDSANAN